MSTERIIIVILSVVLVIDLINGLISRKARRALLKRVEILEKYNAFKKKARE